jgi:hypothetical protein
VLLLLLLLGRLIERAVVASSIAWTALRIPGKVPKKQGFYKKITS